MLRRQEIEANRYEKYSDECRQILEEGRRYINRLDQLNDVIVDALMSQKLDHLKAVMEKIFASLEKSPDLAEGAGEVYKLLSADDDEAGRGLS